MKPALNTGIGPISGENFALTTQNMPFGYLRDALKLMSLQQHLLQVDFNLNPPRHGLDPAAATKGEFFSLMRKIVHFDRMRRQAIMEGRLRDIEHFPGQSTLYSQK